MQESGEIALAPVRGKARIDVLDILRGIAILGIFYINVPYMAAPVQQFGADIRSIGWTAADRNAWAFVTIFFAGTQRCLLEFLFGAGMMIFARKAMTPDGPVAVADLYYRRNMWLLGFGLVDVFLLLWPGDILHIYALAALFLFPFRRLAPKWLLLLGLSWAALSTLGIPEYGVREYVARSELVQLVDSAHARAPSGAVTPEEFKALGEWRKLEASHAANPERQARIAKELRAHQGGLPYFREAWDSWTLHIQEWLIWDVLEAFCTMLIGVALWQWGVIQGQRSKRFYLLLMLGGYGFGIAARAIGVSEVLRFDLGPRTLWITGEWARLAMGLGHLALVNWLFQTRLGHAALGIFKAPGKMAFSLYFAQQFIGMYLLFSPFGLMAWGHYGWAEMVLFSSVGVVLLIGFAHLWMRWFASGPLEWMWRSLTYVEVQPLSRPRPSVSTAAVQGAS